jgi:hypothetical protein
MNINYLIHNLTQLKSRGVEDIQIIDDNWNEYDGEIRLAKGSMAWLAITASTDEDDIEEDEE